MPPIDINRYLSPTGLNTRGRSAPLIDLGLPQLPNLSGVLPQLPQLPNLSSPLAGSSPRAVQYPVMPMQEEEAFASKLIGGAASGAQAVGSILDIPGGAIRNAIAKLAGQEIKGHEDDYAFKRISGREQLEQFGLLGPNKEGLDWGDVGGFLYEVATDPLTYLSLGAGAVTKAGKALGKTGKMADVIRKGVAAKHGGVAATSFSKAVKESFKYGKGTFLRENTLDSALRNFGDDGLRSLVKKQLGPKEYSKLIDQPLSYGARFEMPIFNRVGFDVATHPLITKAVDATGAGLRLNPVTRFGARMFDYYKGDASTIPGQAAMKAWQTSFEKKAEDTAFMLHGLMRNVHKVGKDLGLNEREATRLFRQVVETGGDPAAIGQMSEAAQKISSTFDEFLVRGESTGVNVREIVDNYASFMPRRINDATGKYSKSTASVLGSIGRRKFPADTIDIAREPFLKDIKGGSNSIENLAWNKEFSGVDVDKAVKPAKSLDDRAYEIAREYRNVDVDEMHRLQVQKNSFEAAGDALEPADAAKLAALEGEYRKARQLARWLGKLDPSYAKEQIPLWEDAWTSVSRYLTSTERALQASDEIHNLIGTTALHAADDATSGPLVGELVEGVKTWQNDQALLNIAKNIAKREDELGEQFRTLVGNLDDYARHAYGGSADMTVKQLNSFKDENLAELLDDVVRSAASVKIPDGVARDINGVWKTFSGDKTALDDMLGWFDKALAVFKTHVTLPFPSFHARNFMSAAIMMGMYRAGYTGKTSKLGTVGLGGGFDIATPINDALEVLSGRVKTGAMARLTKLDPIAEAAAERLGQTVDFVRANKDSAAVKDMVAEVVRDMGSAYNLTGQGTGMADIALRAKDPHNPADMHELIQNISGEGAFKARQQGQSGADYAFQRFMKTGITEDRKIKAEGLEWWEKQRFNPFSRAASSGGTLSSGIEDTVRLATFLGYLDQGFDTASAAMKSRQLHVDYSKLTTFEKQIMRRTIPFYSFTRGMIPNVVDQIVGNPGGPVGAWLRFNRRQRQDVGVVPEHVGQQSAIGADNVMRAIGGLHPSLEAFNPEPGTKRILGNIDLPINAVLNTVQIGENIQDTMQKSGMKLLSQLNPYAKYGLETATGKLFFQNRDLDQVSENTKIFGSPTLSHALYSSPAARWLRLAHPNIDREGELTLEGTFPNIYSNEEGRRVPELYNTFIGMGRLTTVRDQDVQRELRRRVNEVINADPLVRTFSTPYVLKEQQGLMTPELRDAFRYSATLNRTEKLAAKRYEAERRRRIAELRRTSP